MSESHSNDREFVFVGDLLRKGTAVDAIATAVEIKGVYTWDRFGRFGEAADGNKDDPSSKEYLLCSLADYYELSMKPQRTDYDSMHLEWMVDDPESSLFHFGWWPEDLPKFDNLLKETGQINPPPRPKREPARQSATARLIKGLVVLNYGKSMIEDLNKEKSKRLSEIKRDLELKGFAFDEKTLRQYLKNIPD